MFEGRKAKKLGLADRGKGEKYHSKSCKSCGSQLRLGMDINTGVLWHWCSKCKIRISEIKSGPITELYD